MMAEEHQIGDYWQETLDGKQVFWVKARTGTSIRHCELDAIKSAENAVKELVKYQKKQKESFQKQVEFLMEDMVEYYENLDDVAEDVKMWVGDYVSWTAQEASRP
jgi:hypothetical protein